MPLNSEQILQLAQGAGFSGNDAQTMAAIIRAESSGNPYAHNTNRATGDNSYGLSQINMIDTLGPARRKQFGLKSNEQLLDPQTNLRAAKQVKDSSGFGAWTTYKSGSYKQFLPEIQKTAAGLPNNPPTTQTSQQTAQQLPGPNTYNFYLSGDNQDTKDFLTSYLPKITGQAAKPESMFDPLSLLNAAFNSGSNYGLD
jgi:hypothetical protein